MSIEAYFYLFFKRFVEAKHTLFQIGFFFPPTPRPPPRANTPSPSAAGPHPGTGTAPSDADKAAKLADRNMVEFLHTGNWEALPTSQISVWLRDAKYQRPKSSGLAAAATRKQDDRKPEKIAIAADLDEHGDPMLMKGPPHQLSTGPVSYRPWTLAL